MATRRKSGGRPPRKIVDARNDAEGDITHVLFRGNRLFTPVEQVIPMADRGEIENAHVVRRRNAKPHLKTNPNGRRANNLDHMADD